MLPLGMRSSGPKAGGPSAFPYHRPRSSLKPEACFSPACMCEIIAAIKGLSPSCRLPDKRSNFTRDRGS